VRGSVKRANAALVWRLYCGNNWSRGTCVYCGTEGVITDDHVPPQCLFPAPRPDDLITVPSCGTCNTGSSNDDEYFKRSLVLRSDLHDHPIASQLRPSVIRSFHNPKQRKFRDAFLRTVRQVPVRTPGGLYLGHVPTFEMSYDRLHRVTNRITTGLYFTVTGFWDHARAEALTIFEPQTVSSGAPAWIERLLTLPETAIGDGVFSYRVKFWHDVPFASAWLMLFYDTVAIIGATKQRGYEPVQFDELMGGSGPL
jgi:hypothetical protein